MQFTELFVHEELRLVVWRHAGHLVKKLELAIDNRPLAKPYLGAPISDEAAVFLALSNDPIPNRPFCLSIRDSSGNIIFESDPLRAQPLAKLGDALDDANALDRLVTRILKQAPDILNGWTETLSAAFADLSTAVSRDAQPLAPSAPEVTTSPNGTTLRAAVDIVDGRYLSGWALDCAQPNQVLRLQFEIDGTPVGTAVADDLREDIDFAGGEFRHGFHVVLRPATLSSPWRPLHRLSIRDLDSGRPLIEGYPIRDQADQEAQEISSISRRIQRMEQALLELREQLPHVRRRTAYSLSDYDLWFEDIHQRDSARLAATGHDNALRDPGARISVIVPLTADCSLNAFQRVLTSLAEQNQDGRYDYVIVNRSQDDQAHEQLARTFAKRMPRLNWVNTRNQTTPALLRRVLHYSAGWHILLLRPAEALNRDALAWFAEGAAQPNAKVIYADSDRIDARGKHCDPQLRPDFNPDLLLATPYIGSFCLARSLLESLVADIDDQDEPEGIWQYDLLLRASERIRPEAWLHIARVLTHRSNPEPGNTETSPAIYGRALEVLRGHLKRTQSTAKVALDDAQYRAHPELTGSPDHLVLRVRWPVPKPAPKVSIIIPSRDGLELVQTCIQSIRQLTDYPDYEILLVDHDSTDPAALAYFDELSAEPGIRVLRYSGAFNWSAINHFAASEATGDVLCFLNNDTEVMTPDWLIELVGHACRPGIGAVGAKLLFRDGTLQHGGVILGAQGLAEHAFTGLPADEPGYMLRAAVTQNLSAVTGACLVCRREVFDAVGGFDMVDLTIAFNDLDFCLRLTEAGYRHVWSPYAMLYHDASKTRGRDSSGEKRARLDQEMDTLRKRWPSQLARDPAYNPAFELHEHPFALLTSTLYHPLPDMQSAER